MLGLNYKKFRQETYKIHKLDQHPFHISYSKNLSKQICAAVDNVFDNFYFFLNFNSFECKSLSFSVGTEQNSDFILSEVFINNLQNSAFNHERWFTEKPVIICNGFEDYIGSVFYMINSLQEYHKTELDALGRFQFKDSYQAKFNCCEDNLVLEYFQQIAEQLFGKKIPLKPSQFQLSHDIDYLHKGWRNDLKEALKSLNIIAVLRIFWNKILGKDSNQNIKEIMLFERAHEVPSCFFFMCEQGETGVSGIENSDYNFNSNYVQQTMRYIDDAFLHIIGLHKSIGKTSIQEELAKIPSYSNRFHYLAFNIPKSFQELSDSSLKFDCSLGFSEKIGFRNSYGLPYQPFNPISASYFDFWEYPLHIMDSTLHFYLGMKNDPSKFEAVERFLEKNSKSAVISVLWHNNYFNPKSYQGLLNILTNGRTPY